MAATLKARSGSAFKAQFKYQQPDGTLVDTTGFTVRFQLRSMQANQRVLLSADASNDNPVLSIVAPGHFRLFLGKSVTNSLPSTVKWELEVFSNSNPEDSTTIASGILNTEPEG